MTVIQMIKMEASSGEDVAALLGRLDEPFQARPLARVVVADGVRLELDALRRREACGGRVAPLILKPPAQFRARRVGDVEAGCGALTFVSEGSALLPDGLLDRLALLAVGGRLEQAVEQPRHGVAVLAKVPQ